MKKKSIIIGSLMGVALTTVAAGAVATGFSDVPDDHWGSQAILNLKNGGIIQGYGDNTFRPNNPVSRAEVAVMMDKHEQKMMAQMNQLKKELNDKITALQNQLDDAQNNDDQNQDDMSLLDQALAANSNLNTISNPNLKLPSDIHSGQINKYYSLGDLRLATVLRPSDNVDLSGKIPADYDATYGGLLIADKDDDTWHKFLRIQDEDQATSAGNNAYSVWKSGDELMLSIVDENGTGSGEGIQKVYSIGEGGDWNLENCYYFGESETSPNFGDEVNDNNYYDYSQEVSKLGDLSNTQRTACEDDVNLTSY